MLPAPRLQQGGRRRSRSTSSSWGLVLLVLCCSVQRCSGWVSLTPVHLNLWLNLKGRAGARGGREGKVELLEQQQQPEGHQQKQKLQQPTHPVPPRGTRSTLLPASPPLMSTAAIPQEVKLEVDGKGGKQDDDYTYDFENGRRCEWRAAKKASKKVEEGGRSLMDYLRLPPSEYSLLSENQIERISEDSFRFVPTEMSFFGNKVIPVVFLKVVVDQENAVANIKVTSVELQGSELMRKATNTIQVECTNVVSSSDVPGEPGKRLITSEVSMFIEVLVPQESWLPTRVLTRGGCFVLQRVLDVGVPQFARFLRRDYRSWSAGSDDRSAVTDGALV